MKGGRTAPRDWLPDWKATSTAAASMKGGRTAPRDECGGRLLSTFCRSFNEGGADCPPRLTDLSPHL